jgi:hypothetical protein
MLQSGAHALILNTTIVGCQANTGGAICTDMADDAQDANATVDTTFDLQTDLWVDIVVHGNKGGNLVVGPYFYLRLLDFSRLAPRSPGVVWRRRLCTGRGGFVSNSGYCERCPPYTYSVDVNYPGHNRTSCTDAPSIAHAPGGAVLVPLKDHWSGANMSVHYLGCTDCTPWIASLEEIKRWVLHTERQRIAPSH